MSFSDDLDTLTRGDDYEIERWTFDDRDEHGHIIWHYAGDMPEGAGPSDTGNNEEPADDEWSRITMITVEYDPGSGDYRNLTVNPDRPLDPPGADSSPYGPEPYDVDDLATGWKIVSP